MLSRAAEGLFWMSRYVERAENLARLLDAGRRINTLPSSPEVRAAEWASIVVAAGCSETFPLPLEEADQDRVVHHLIFDTENFSSIYSCFRQARSNARAMRVDISTDVWDAVNDAWTSMRAQSAGGLASGGFATFLDWTKMQSQRIRGAVESTSLRGPGFEFIRLGQYIERADATARLLDVKYHVLLPASTEIGGALDQVQWAQILLAANSLRAYRHVYRAPVTPDRVVHFLLLNATSPRSVQYSNGMIGRHLGNLRFLTGRRHSSHDMAGSLVARLQDHTVQEVFAFGLHEFLTELIGQNNRLAVEIAENYGFGSRPAPASETVEA